ncbi:hypothetical protein BDZ90DRAFT_232587 [Jaminaea rosea]|uniref:non-specific serine/threonine protein kinase n=1 Tax=Jaminaea rosea TaxID=1569628 RepID=A0A316UP16_9BASI|nr:hypothetical protein BDZ90DRAFT_232587 [Jaminaea rosea]PWN27010.1 hypothetical protein BDZ90DRAFT_232587 [Jaminaea rosea]
MGEKMEDATVKATPRASSSSHDAAAPAQHQQSNASASRPRSGSSETDLKDYTLGDCLGKGAFGSVYRGLNWKTGETVAIKHISLADVPPSEQSEIMSEIDLLQNLKHPNIVKYRGSDKTPNGLYIILEYCENGSLQHICKRFGRFPEGLVSVYIYQVLLGLAYLHDQGVIHRDIKGANILTTKEGAVKLADFGVATKAGAALADGAVVGSPYWMAPEVIDQSGATTASDIWSVGCVVVELLEGQPPYHFLAPMPALFRIVQDDCPPLPDGLSTVVKDFLLKCFQKDVDLRASAQQLLEHPWMMAAKWQLERLNSRKGGSAKQTGGGGVTHDEAVKTVKRWNEALKEIPARPRALRRTSASTPDLPKSRQRASTSGATLGSRTPLKPLATLQENEAVVDPLKSPSTPAVPRVVDAMSVDSTKCASTAEEDEQMATLRASKIKAAATPAPAVPQLLTPTGTPARTSNKRCPSPSPISKTGSLRPSQAAAVKKSVKRVRQNNGSASSSSSSSDDDEDEMAHAGDNAVVRLSTFRSNVQDEPPSPALKSRRRMVGGHSKAVTDGDAQQASAAPAAVILTPAAIAATPTRQTHSALPYSPSVAVAVYSEPTAGQDVQIQRKVLREQTAQACADVVALTERLTSRVDIAERELLRVANDLEVLLLDEDETTAQALITVFWQAHGPERLLKLVEQSERSTEVRGKCLTLLGLICGTDAEAITTPAIVKGREKLCLLGALPILITIISSTTKKQMGLVLRTEAAHLFATLVNTSADTLRCTLACQGMKTFVRLVDSDFTKQGQLVQLGVRGIAQVLASSKAPAGEVDLSQMDLCRLLAQEGLLEPLSAVLVSALDAVEIQEADEQEDSLVVLEQALRILLVLSAIDDQAVKQRVAQRTILRRLLIVCLRMAGAQGDNASSTARMPLSILLLRIIRNLTLHGSVTLEALQHCSAIPTLVRILSAHQSGIWAKEVARRILFSLFNLCRLNRARQEELAAAGGLPLLIAACESQSGLLRHYALPVLCDLASTSRETRRVLWKGEALPCFLKLLASDVDKGVAAATQTEWQTMALEAIVIWLSEEQTGGASKVEEILLRPASIEAILTAFTRSSAALDSLVEPTVKLLRASPRLAAVLREAGKCSTSLLRSVASQLQEHPKAIVRLNLLRILKLVLFSATTPGDQAVRGAAEARAAVQLVAKKDSAVLVRKMARELLSSMQRSGSSSSGQFEDAEDDRDEHEVLAEPVIFFSRPLTSSGIQRTKKPMPLSLQPSPVSVAPIGSTPATPRTGSSTSTRSGIDELLMPASPAIGVGKLGSSTGSSNSASTSSGAGRTRSGTIVPDTSNRTTRGNARVRAKRPATAATATSAPKDKAEQSSSPWAHLATPLGRSRSSAASSSRDTSRTSSTSSARGSGSTPSIRYVNAEQEPPRSPKWEAVKAAEERQRGHRKRSPMVERGAPSTMRSEDERMRTIESGQSRDSNDRWYTPASPRSSVSPGPSPPQRSASSGGAAGARRAVMQRFWNHYRPGGHGGGASVEAGSMDR